MSKPRVSGHAETPYLIGTSSLLIGLVWATLFVSKHAAYAWWAKLLIFLISPLIGLLLLSVFIALLLTFGFIGDWLDKQFDFWRSRSHSRKN